MYFVIDQQEFEALETAAATAGISPGNLVGRDMLAKMAKRDGKKEPAQGDMEKITIELIVAHPSIKEKVRAELEADEDWLAEALKERLTAQ